MVAVAVLVVTCPCALSLATPAAMLAAAGTLARHGVLVRNLQALESLAEIDTLIFDKTGTLTQDGQRVTQVMTAEGVTPAYALGLAAAGFGASVTAAGTSATGFAASGMAAVGVAAIGVASGTVGSRVFSRASVAP